jgi:hypothetical protein
MVDLYLASFHSAPYCAELAEYVARPSHTFLKVSASVFVHYSDYTQFYVALKGVNSIPKLLSCFRAMRHGLDLNGLPMKADKTRERCHRHLDLTTSRRSDRINYLGDFHVHTSLGVKSFEVVIEGTLPDCSPPDTWTTFAIVVHIWALRHIGRCVNIDNAKTIASAAVSSRLEYCNSALCGTSAENIHKLQYVRKSLARVALRFRFLRAQSRTCRRAALTSNSAPQRQ